MGRTDGVDSVDGLDNGSIATEGRTRFRLIDEYRAVIKRGGR